MLSTRTDEATQFIGDMCQSYAGSKQSDGRIDFAQRRASSSRQEYSVQSSFDFCSALHHLAAHGY